MAQLKNHYFELLARRSCALSQLDKLFEADNPHQGHVDRQLNLLSSIEDELRSLGWKEGQDELQPAA